MACCQAWRSSGRIFMASSASPDCKPASPLQQVGFWMRSRRIFSALSEPDAAFRVRIQKELVRERNTRNAVVSVLTDLTGRTPEVFEPSRPADTGGYGIGSGYGLVGGWGSLALPYQCFVTAYRAHSSGIATVAGYGGPTGGYGTGAIEYASLSMIQGQIADSDIEAAITRVMPCSAIAWTRISN